MKHLLAIFLFTSILFSNVQDYLPDLTGRVVDNAQILDKNTISSLEKILQNQEKNSTNQIVVATIKSLHGYSVEEFSLNLARKWKLGQKDKNNGVLLLVAPNEKKIRIEVGYGLEGALTDKISHEIITYTIAPYFKKGDFNSGILNGTKDIIKATNLEFKSKTDFQDIDIESLMLIIFCLSFTLLIFSSIIEKPLPLKIGLSSLLSTFSLPISSIIFSSSITIPVIIMIIIAIFIFFTTTSNDILNTSSSSKNTGSSSDFSSINSSYSSGFSGGGGSFGGGGASGSW